MRTLYMLLFLFAALSLESQLVGPGSVATIGGNAPRKQGGAVPPAAGGGGGSNVTFDTSAASACGVVQDTRVINISVANQANRLLVVMAGGGDTILADRTVDSVVSDVDGAFTAVSSGAADDANFTRMEAWRLVAPTVGAHVITVTYASGGNCRNQIAAGASLYGVDQSSPVGTPTVVNGTATSTTPNGAVTLGSDDMAIGALYTDSETLSWTTGTSMHVEANCDGDVSYGIARNTGTGSISVQASTIDNRYALVVIPINGAP